MDNDSQSECQGPSAEYNLGMMDTLSWISRELYREPTGDRYKFLQHLVDGMISECEERRAFAFEDFVESRRVMIEEHFPNLHKEGSGEGTAKE
jgi:hypothetical protein